MKAKFVFASLVVALAGTAGNASGSVDGKPILLIKKRVLYHSSWGTTR